MGKPSAPAPPDPTVTANAQANANKDAVYASARANQVNQYTPYGSLEWSGTPEAGDQTVTQTLDPDSQAILDLQRSLGVTLAGQANDSLSNPYQINSNFNLPDDINANREQVEKAYFDRVSNLLTPEFDRQRKREETALVNQGIPRGSEAFDDRYYDQLVESQNRTLSDAANAAVQAGGAEQSRLFGLTQQGRQQDINEELMLRSQPINELAAVLTGNQAINTPQFTSTPNYQIAPADVIGSNQLNYNGQMNAFNNRNSNFQAGLGGLFSLGAAGIPLLG